MAVITSNFKNNDSFHSTAFSVCSMVVTHFVVKAFLGRGCRYRDTLQKLYAALPLQRIPL